MPDTTTRLELEQPLSADTVSALRTAIGQHADVLDDAVLYDEGPIGSRPTSSGGSPGIKGRLYRATDEDVAFNGRWYFDYGTGWVQVAMTLPAVETSILYALVLG